MTREDSPDSLTFTSRASADTGRTELPWEDREELQIRKWQTEANGREKQHARKSKYFKHLHYGFGVTAMALPFAGTLGSTFLRTHSKEFTSIILATTTLCAGVNTFFNFGQKSERHADYENRYAEFSATIDKELAKPRKFRIACDVCMEFVTATLARLTAAAPDI